MSRLIQSTHFFDGAVNTNNSLLALPHERIQATFILQTLVEVW